MRNIVRLGLAAAAIVAIGHSAQAAAIYVWNDHNSPVWVTVYDNTNSQMWTACVLPKRVSGAMNYNKIWWGNRAKLRYEYKDGKDCGGKTLMDTGIAQQYALSKSDINAHIPAVSFTPITIIEPKF